MHSKRPGLQDHKRSVLRIKDKERMAVPEKCRVHRADKDPCGKG